MVPLIALLTGCGGGGGGGGDDQAIDAATVVVDAASSGDHAIFVVNRGDTSIRVFDRMAAGNTPPLRTIRGGNTQLAGPIAIAVDAANGEIYVANGVDNSILVFAIDADGNVPPTRRIAGAATGLAIVNAFGGGCDSPFGGLQVDSSTNELVVPCSDLGTTGCLQTFSRTANGNVAPLRNITGPATQLPNSTTNDAVTRAIYVDLATDEIFVVVGRQNFVVFDRTATGDVAPVRSNSGGQLCFVDLVTDPAAGELWVNTSGSSASTFEVFARTANGSLQPLRSILHSGTGAMFLDPARGEAIVISPTRIDTVNTTTGATIRTIQGMATGLDGVNDLAVVP